MENEHEEEKSKKRKEREQMDEEMGETPPNKLPNLQLLPPSNSINNENNNDNINNNNENNLNSTIELSENKIDIETNLLNEKKKWLEVWKEMLIERGRRAILANGQGNYYFASGQYDKAIENYKEAIKNNPNDVIINENIAKTYVKNGLYKKALKHFKVIEEDISTEEICYELGTELYSIGDYKKSIGFFRIGLEMYPTQFGSRLNLSLSLEALKKYDEALEQLQIILSQTKNSEIVGNVYTIMGMIHILIDKYEEGMEYVKLAVNMNPSNHNYFNIGKALDNKNKYEEAIEYYKKALEIDPIDIRVRSNLGYSYIKMKRFDDAINQQKISPELDALLKEKRISDYHVFYIFSDTRIAMALIRKKEFEKANKIILKIFTTLKEVPESESDLEVIRDVYFIRGLFHYKTARYQGAIEDFELSSYNYSSDDYVVPPLHHEVNYYYAMSLMKLGNDEKSKESNSNYFEKALEKFNHSIKDEKDWSKAYFRKAQLFLFYLLSVKFLLQQ